MGHPWPLGVLGGQLVEKVGVKARRELRVERGAATAEIHWPTSEARHLQGTLHLYQADSDGSRSTCHSVRLGRRLEGWEEKLAEAVCRPVHCTRWGMAGWSAPVFLRMECHVHVSIQVSVCFWVSVCLRRVYVCVFTSLYLCICLGGVCMCMGGAVFVLL